MKALTPLLSHQRPAVRKRAVTTLAVLVSASGDVKLFEGLVNNTIVKNLKRVVALETVEVLVLKCPTEVSGSIKQITACAVEWIKWDPVSVEFHIVHTLND
jgi:hypothetical protein